MKAETTQRAESFYAFILILIEKELEGCLEILPSLVLKAMKMRESKDSMTYDHH